MASTPRRTIEPDFIAGMSCPICGADALNLHVMERYPDYVDCDNCQSQFVAEEGGDRVMFGKIPNSYPKTRKFALQQWAWAEAVERRAAGERPEVPIATAPPMADSPPPMPEMPSSPEPEAEEQAPVEAAPMSAESEFSMEAGQLAVESEPPENEPDAEPEMADAMAEARIEAEVTGEHDSEPGSPGQWEPDPVEAHAEPSATADAGWAMPAMDASPEPAPLEASVPSLDEPGEEPEMLDEFFDHEPVEQADAAFEPEFRSVEDAGFDTPVSTFSKFTAEPDEPSWEQMAPPLPEEEKALADEFMSGGADDADSEDLLDVFGAAAAATPPFAEGVEAEADDLPSDMEPAPPMPSWLESGLEESSFDMEETDEDGAEIPVDEEEMLDRLWQSTEPMAMEDTMPSGTDAPDQPFELPEWDAADMDSIEAAEVETPAASVEAGESALDADELARMHWGGEALVQQAAAEETAEPAATDAEREPTEPEPGRRHRVVLRTSQASMPAGMCAHCGRTPAGSELTVTATVYRGAGLGERQMASYRVPVCTDCYRRARARSEEQQTAQLQAHLISVLVAMVMVIGALAFRLVDFQGSLLLDLGVLGLLAGMGYAIPAVFLLIRAGSYPQPPDAQFVETTLRIPADTEGAETAFEWRNRAYADRFHAANAELAVSTVTKITERSYEGA